MKQETATSASYAAPRHDAEAPLVLEIDGSTYGQDVLFICNDWQTGILPVYLLYKYKLHNTYMNARSWMVIHNIAYQGKYCKDGTVQLRCRVCVCVLT